MHGRILIIVGVSGLLLLSVFLVMFKSSLKPPVPTVKSNSWIVNPVILHHFVPFGKALIRLQDGRLP